MRVFYLGGDKMEQVTLVYPRMTHKSMAKRYAKECARVEETILNGAGGYHINIEYETWLKKEKQNHLGIHLDSGFVPATTYFCLADNELVGMLNIRHCLNEFLRQQGGHIGYSVAPSKRNQGYATKMLQQAIMLCKDWDIYPILITCHKENIASRKTIEKCGGILENEYFNEETKETYLRFWIGERK